MDFFKLLDQQDEVDLSLRIFKKDGQFTIGVLPGSNKSSTKPINITGTAEDLDNEFFDTLLPQIKEVKGIVSNISKVKKEIEDEEANENELKQAKKTVAATSSKKAAAKKEVEKVVEPVLFGGDDKE